MNKLVDTLVIDYSAVAKSCLGRVTGKNYGADQEKQGREISNDAMEEWYYQVASTMITLQGACNCDEVIIAMDSKPYWRSAVVEKYYMDNNTYWADLQNGRWVIDREGTLTLATWDVEIEQWILTNITKKVKEELGFDETKEIWPSTWMYFPKGEMTPEETERTSAMWGQAVPSSAYSYPAFTDQKLFEKEQVSYPYKHGRKWQWEQIIDSSEFNEKSELFAHMVAPFVKGKTPIRVEHAEADDVIHSVCKLNHSKGLTTAIASVDADLKQLVGTYKGTQYISLTGGLEMIDTTPAKEDHAFRCKVIGGDNSDKIRGVRKVTIRKKDGVVTNITKPQSVDAGEKWVGQFKADFHENVANKLDQVSYMKNVELVDLCACPKHIQEHIEDELTKLEFTTKLKDPEPTLEDINIGQMEMAEIESDIKLLNSEWGVLVGFEADPTLVVEEPVEEAPKPQITVMLPKAFKFTGTVEAHPTNEDFKAWDLPEVEAEHPAGAIEKWKELYAPAQFSDFVSRTDEGWKWWECDITITDMS